MKKFSLLVLGSALLAATLSAQTAEIASFQGLMTPLNETPPIAITDFPGAALGTVTAHVVRDSTGKIISGTVDFTVDYKVLGSGITITGLHIHRGLPGVAGAIVIPTDISATNPVKDDTGFGQVNRAAQVLPTDAVGLSALNDLFADPSQFYINLHTPEHPGGAIRAQLSRPTTIRLMGIMTPQQEVPPITDLNASAVVLVNISATLGDTPELTAARVTYQMKYAFPTAQTFTGFHIHRGPPGVAAPVVLDSGISGTATVASDPSGSGILTREFVVSAFDPGFATELAAVRDLVTNPGGFYINAHTPEHPGGVIRAQLRRVDDVIYHVNMLPSNETPPITGLAASAPARVVVNTLRGDDGAAIAAAVTFDVNYRFPAAATFTGLHIHDGATGVAGPVTIPTNLGAGTASVVSDSGFGNITRVALVSDTTGLATVANLLGNPEKTYINLHTVVNPGGAIRSQVGAALAASPKVDAVISAVNDKTITSVAQGGLMTIYGSNLARNSSDLSAFTGTSVPTSFNGVQVTIGGKAAPLIFVSPTQINLQAPFDTPLGSQMVVVSTGGVASSSFPVNVVAAAPGIFINPADGTGILVKQDFSLVTADNRARANDIIIIYATGLGQTTPASTTGMLVQFPPEADTKPVTITVAGQQIDPANVIYSIAAPNFIGLYQVAFRVPTTVPGGTQRVQISVNGVNSNVVTAPFISVDR